jgi:hypothetical protein
MVMVFSQFASISFFCVASTAVIFAIAKRMLGNGKWIWWAEMAVVGVRAGKP